MQKVYKTGLLDLAMVTELKRLRKVSEREHDGGKTSGRLPDFAWRVSGRRMERVQKNEGTNGTVR